MAPDPVENARGAPHPRANAARDGSEGFTQSPWRIRSTASSFGRWALVSVAVLPLLWFIYAWATFPSDRTPEGAYLRVVKAVNEGKPAEFFAYIEEEAQHACFTIRNYRKEALELAKRSFPEEEYVALEVEYGQMAAAKDGAEVFAHYAKSEGWMAQLRRDLSGIHHVERSGKRATVQTIKGTRYAFRERPNGIYGLTAFTPALAEEAARAARDLELVKQAAADYQRSKKRMP